MNQTRMPLSELEQTPEFQVLTPKQKLFVQTYVGGGVDLDTYDAIGAIMTAYRCKSHEVARTMSYTMLGNIRIVAVLNRHFNRAPLEDFIHMLDLAIRRKKLSNAQLSALRLKADLLGYTSRMPVPGQTIKDVVEAVQLEQRVRRKRGRPRTKPVQAPVEPEVDEYSAISKRMLKTK